MDELLAQMMINSNQDRRFGSNVTEDTLWLEPRISDARIQDYGIRESFQSVLVSSVYKQCPKFSSFHK